VRNTKIVDVVKALREYGIAVTITDPLASREEVMHEYGLEMVNAMPTEKFDAVVLGVPHKEFKQLDYKSVMKDSCVLYDVKGILGDLADGRL
jgi:UDP-N-acetyl-D-galactosamine dehydrogenase